MEKAELFETVIKNDGKFFFVVNTKNKEILNIYLGDTLIAPKLSYHDLAVEFAKVYGLVLDFEAKTMRFLNNLNPGNESFSLTVSYNTLNNKTLRILYKGIRINSDEILFITNTEQSTENSFDELTKSYSRGYVMGVVKESIVKNVPFALMIVDVDNFKEYNDTYGHMFGDIVLIEIASAIKDFIGDRGYVSRIGGDEFLVYYKLDDSIDAYEACRSLKQNVLKASTISARNVEYTVTIGCSRFPTDGDTYELLFRKADKALYRGKRKARNCFVLYYEDKCGPVSENDDFGSANNPIDKSYNSNTNMSLITAILEVLNKEQGLSLSLDEILPLIGNFFTLDRITLVETDPIDDSLIDLKIWYNPRSNKEEYVFNFEDIASWREALGSINMLKLNQVSANQNVACYKSLVSNNTSALVACELRGEGKAYGIVKFEMTSVNRFWQQNDVSTLTLIARILSIKINKDYNTKKQIEDLYYDRLTKAYNYNKWLIEVNDYIKLNNIKEYTIIDIGINDFRGLINFIGTNKTDELLKYLVRELGKEAEIIFNIYCRVGDSRFLLFVPENNDLINILFKNIVLNIKVSNNWKNYVILFGGAAVGTKSDDVSTIVDHAFLARKRKRQNNTLVHYDKEIFEIEKRNIELRLHVNEAIEQGEFLLYLQPKIDAKTGKIAGAEALTRWNYRFKEMIYPDVFIPLLEENGLIINLDYKVFENVCKFIDDMKQKSKPVYPISVNLSRYIVDFNKYLRDIEKIRNRYKIDADLIEFEITERMYTSNTSSIYSFVNSLHELGYRVSMDDFGAGYSNFSTLSKLNFDLIKIDKELCLNIEKQKANIILKTIIELIDNLNMKSLCEGVENIEMANYLKSIGCDYIQGFLYDKALPLEEFINKYEK